MSRKMENEKQKDLQSPELTEEKEQGMTDVPSESVANGEKAKPAKKKKKWKKIVAWTITLIVVLALVFCLIIVVQTKSSKKPFLFGYASYVIVSGSMEPELQVGDVILIKKVNSIDELKVGDTITYLGKEDTFAGKTVTHRIVRIEGNTIVTRGISEQIVKDDPPITFDDVIGKYVKTSSFLTAVYTGFSSKYGFLFVIFIPLLALLIVQVVNFVRACKMDKDGKMPKDKTEEEIKEEVVKEREAELKRKAIEEYLASKKRIEKASQKKKEDK